MFPSCQFKIHVSCGISQAHLVTWSFVLPKDISYDIFINSLQTISPKVTLYVIFGMQEKMQSSCILKVLGSWVDECLFSICTKEKDVLQLLFQSYQD